MSVDSPKWLTHQEAADRARMSPSTLWERIKQGEGPKRYRVGGKVLYDAGDVDEWIDDHAEDAELEAS